MNLIWRLFRAWFPRTTDPKPPVSPLIPAAMPTNDTGPPGGICDRVIAAALAVSKLLGAGLPEIIYENALAHELRKAGFDVCQQNAIPVYYDGKIVGNHTADLVVDNTVMIELKPIEVPDAVHTVQCMNYLKATGLTLCLTLSFTNSILSIKRVLSPPNG